MLDRRAEAERSGHEAPSNLLLVEIFGILIKLIRGGVRASTVLRLLTSTTDILMIAPDELRPLLLRRAKLDISVDLFNKLRRKHTPDFVAFVTFLVDFAQHRFWIFHEPYKFADAPAHINSRLASVEQRIGTHDQYFTIPAINVCIR